MSRGAGGAPPRAWFGRVEIPSPDPERAAAFYRRVFGWRVRQVESDGDPYLSLHPAAPSSPGPPSSPPPPGPGLEPAVEPGVQSGAEPGAEPGAEWRQAPAPMPPVSPAGGGVTTPRTLGSPVPLPVIHVEGLALEAVLERIEAAGGRTDLAPTAVGSHGTFARFTDPDGNLLGLWSDDVRPA